MLLKVRSRAALLRHFDVLMCTLKINLMHTAFTMPGFCWCCEDYSITQKGTVLIRFVADTWGHALSASVFTVSNVQPHPLHYHGNTTNGFNFLYSWFRAS